MSETYSISNIHRDEDMMMKKKRDNEKVQIRLQQAQWLRAAILGANDGLLSTTFLMLGVGAVYEDRRSIVVSGVDGALAGACSIAIGEFVSVSTQKDIKKAVVYNHDNTKMQQNNDGHISLVTHATSTPKEEITIEVMNYELVLTPSSSLETETARYPSNKFMTSKLSLGYFARSSPRMKVIQQDIIRIPITLQDQEGNKINHNNNNDDD